MSKVSGFYSSVVSQELHEFLKKEYSFTDQELDILDYTTIPQLKDSVDIECLKRPNKKTIEHSKEARHLRGIVQKLHYIIYDLTKID